VPPTLPYYERRSPTSTPGPDQFFEFLADPANHPLLNGSGASARRGTPARADLALGARFGMDMRIGLPYKILNTVFEFEPDRLIA
jgi:hypothetical protein